MCAQANAGTVLDRILESRRAEVEHRKKVLPETALKYGVQAASPLRDFVGALSRPGLNVVAELKPASPSRGEPGLGPATTFRPGRSRLRRAVASCASRSTLSLGSRRTPRLGE